MQNKTGRVNVLLECIIIYVTVEFPYLGIVISHIKAVFK